MHIYIHTYIHTYIHILTYFQWLFYSSIWKKSLTLFLVKTSKEILCKISIFGLWRSTQLVFQPHISVTLHFQAFLLVLFGFLYKTAQKPLKNPSNTAWKTVQKSPQEMSGFWAVFERFFKQGLSALSGFSKETAQTAQTLLENRSNRPYLERCLSGMPTRAKKSVLSFGSLKNDLRR